MRLSVVNQAFFVGHIALRGNQRTLLPVLSDDIAVNYKGTPPNAFLLFYGTKLMTQNKQLECRAFLFRGTVLSVYRLLKVTLLL